MRYLQALLCASLVSYGLFFIMQQMIALEAKDKPIVSENALIDFVRLKKDTQSQTKERQLKIPPKPQKPQISRNTVSQQENTTTPTMKMPSIVSSLNLSGNDGLAGFVSKSGMDGNAIALVQVMPQYPPNAKRRKIEGYVKLTFIINEDGTVGDVNVLESNPSGVFDRSAIRAAYRWKFKPRVIEGKPIIQKSTQTMEFNLGKS
jgi:protein TonB